MYQVELFPSKQNINGKRIKINCPCPQNGIAFLPTRHLYPEYVGMLFFMEGLIYDDEMKTFQGTYYTYKEHRELFKAEK